MYSSFFFFCVLLDGFVCVQKIWPSGWELKLCLFYSILKHFYFLESNFAQCSPPFRLFLKLCCVWVKEKKNLIPGSVFPGAYLVLWRFFLAGDLLNRIQGAVRTIQNNANLSVDVDNHMFVLFIFFFHIKLTRNNVAMGCFCSSVSHCLLDVRLCIHMWICTEFPLQASPLQTKL